MELPAHAQARELLQRLGQCSKAGLSQREAFGARLHTDLTHPFALLADGVLTAKIGTCYPLAAVAEVAATMELVESSGRTALGKIILVP